MTDAFLAARIATDECHKKDPAYIARISSTTTSNNDTKAKVDELAYADEMEYWASHLIGLRLETPEYHAFASEVSPSPTSDVQSITRTGELLRIAARCQHLERFLTPRASYPDGKAGYLKWRRDLYKIQADRAKELLLEAGVEEKDANWVHKWVSKTELNPGKETGDMGTQLLEDAAVLVFLQQELELFAGQHQEYEEQKFVDIIKKTWRKLSPLGKQEALKLSMPKGLEPIVLKGIAAMEGTAAPVTGEQQQEGTSSATTAQIESDAASRKKQTSSAAPLARPLRPKTAAEAEALLAARASQPSDADTPDMFGARLLTSDADIWTHNAWDHVVPPSSHYEAVAATLARQAETKLSLEEAEEFHSKPAGYWDTFYSAHENRFFKDRKWLHLEFPELVEATLEAAGDKTVLEVGCGAGNTVFPLLEINKNPKLRIHACDYSSEAVSVVRSNPLYTNPTSNAFCLSTVWDLSSPTALPEGLEPGSVDIIVLIFVFSALHPREWQQAINNIRTLLKPGGMVLFRDYGRYDLPQLRFKKRRMLQDNFYLRGDGTRVYFFEPEELFQIFNAQPQSTTTTTIADEESGEVTEVNQTIEGKNAEEKEKREKKQYDFVTNQMAIDRRLIVNRKERKQMYRVWLQAKFQLLGKD
ncbi:probable ABP140 - actin filament-binding protein [Ustilago trichophora]|uniref:Probable ABP140 - actin filament-binding protein n=1 Tax=Ustilago trichophora TaxID=86804 RepID=A0A5C3EE27_9BASI|nr:probable ABP140 - actin filament-binding protein [Ustilago trichophora]